MPLSWERLLGDLIKKGFYLFIFFGNDPFELQEEQDRDYLKTKNGPESPAMNEQMR
jgi:hypothetical protein